MFAFTAEAKKPSNKDFESLLKSFKKAGTQVSAQIVNLTNTRELISVNADEALNPASSIKLFTAYEALTKLGINFSFKTEVFQNPDRSLCVKGHGDPSFVMEDLYLMVDALKRKGVDKYSGKIVLDTSAFDQELYPEDRTDQNSERAYNAPISALNFNYNTISVFVNPTRKGDPARIGLDFPFDFVEVHGKVITGSSTDVSWDKKASGATEVVTLGGKIAEGADEWRKPFRIRDPAKAFGQAMAKMLAMEGISATGAASYSAGTCSDDSIYTYTSKPLSYIVQLMDKYSNNFIADTLVKVLDHEVANHNPGTTAGGIQLIKNDLKGFGIDLNTKGRSFVSGSGLTRDNMASASDFIRLLKHIHQEKLVLPEMFTSLPIASMDGTLKRKYAHSDASMRLRGKTGTLNGVQSLVGIFPNSDGEWIAVAIITNGSRGIPENDLANYLGTL